MKVKIVMPRLGFIWLLFMLSVCSKCGESKKEDIQPLQKPIAGTGLGSPDGTEKADTTSTSTAGSSSSNFEGPPSGSSLDGDGDQYDGNENKDGKSINLNSNIDNQNVVTTNVELVEPGTVSGIEITVQQDESIIMDNSSHKSNDTFCELNKNESHIDNEKSSENNEDDFKLQVYPIRNRSDSISSSVSTSSLNSNSSLEPKPSLKEQATLWWKEKMLQRAKSQMKKAEDKMNKAVQNGVKGEQLEKIKEGLNKATCKVSKAEKAVANAKK